eukprot:scaffold536_cov124-Skeletonema_dohrnii-CCMP3373.AAC.7
MVFCKCCQPCALVCRVITNFWLIGGIVCEFAEQRRNNQGLGLIFSEQLNEFGSYQCVESVSLYSAIFSQGCTFLIYISSPCYFGGNGITCKMGYGTVWSITAWMAYLIASCFLCFSPKHDPSTCCSSEDEAAKQYDEEQPAPAEQKAAEATVVAAAVVQEEKKQPEEAKVEVEEPQAVEKKEVAEETPVAAAAAAPVKEETVEETPVVAAASDKEEAAEETSVAAAASVKEEAVDEPSVAASVKEEEEEAAEEPEEEEDEGEAIEVDSDSQIIVSVKEDGSVSTRLDPSVTGNSNAPDPDDVGEDDVMGEEPDGDKFVSESIKSTPSMQTAPW